MTMWAEKEQLLKEMLDLQLLNTEAERIDAATKGHEAFLEITNLGVSVTFFNHLSAITEILLLVQQLYIQNCVRASVERRDNQEQSPYFCN